MGHQSAKDSLELLREYLEQMPGCVVHVVRNGYFGDGWKAKLFDTARSAMPF